MCLAAPGRIVSIEGDEPMFRSGIVNFGGIRKQVSLAYVPDARIGDYALVHAGFAIGLVDEAEALQVLEYLRRIEDLAEEESAETR